MKRLLAILFLFLFYSTAQAVYYWEFCHPDFTEAFWIPIPYSNAYGSGSKNGLPIEKNPDYPKLKLSAIQAIAQGDLPKKLNTVSENPLLQALVHNDFLFAAWLIGSGLSTEQQIGLGQTTLTNLIDREPIDAKRIKKVDITQKLVFFNNLTQYLESQKGTIFDLISNKNNEAIKKWLTNPKKGSVLLMLDENNNNLLHKAIQHHNAALAFWLICYFPDLLTMKNKAKVSPLDLLPNAIDLLKAMLCTKERSE